MLADRQKEHILNAAAVLTGLAGPFIVISRPTIDITLALAFILCLLTSTHKENWNKIKPLLNHWLVWVIALTAVGLSINIPFSLDIRLSFEAWIRTYVLLSAIGYTVFCLRCHSDLILKSLTISTALILLAGLFSLFHISKPIINAYMLIMPMLLYQCFKEQKKIWVALGLFSLFAYIGLTLLTSAKASLAGLILMGAGSLGLYSFKRFGFVKSTFALSIFIACIALGLSQWLPDNLNATSSASTNFAFLPIWIVDLHRQLIWTFSIDLAKQSLWVGYGLNASNYHPLAQTTITAYFGPYFNDVPILAEASVLPAHPHNWIIEILLDGGLFGLIPMLGCVIGIFFICVKNYYQSLDPVLLLLIALSIGFWSTSLLNFSFWSVWWLSLYFLYSSLSIVLLYQHKGINDA